MRMVVITVLISGGHPYLAYPARVTVWDDVKLALIDLEGTGALASHPNLTSSEDRPPPFRIKLAPWATDAAEDLNRRFGDDVALTVGAMAYPSMQLPDRPIGPQAAEAADPSEFVFELEGKAEVRSGHSITIGLRVHNLTAADVTVRTNGCLTASIVDPATGDQVGEYVGWQTAPLVRFTVPAGGSDSIRLLIGTTSLRPELGYAVPPGEWAVSADLALEDGRVLRAPPMAITVTD